jgi:hypothetical protein
VDGVIAVDARKIPLLRDIAVTIQSAGGGLPWLAGDAVADSVEDVDAVLAQGGDVGADSEPGSGSFFGAVAAGDLDLGFRGPEVSFRLVVGVRDGQVVSTSPRRC